LSSLQFVEAPRTPGTPEVSTLIIQSNLVCSLSWSVGSIILTAIAAALLIYLLVGILCNGIKGKSGLQLIPHMEFWREIPGYAKEGVLFIKDKMCGLCNSAEGYTSIA